jgi:hypothetical protein
MIAVIVSPPRSHAPRRNGLLAALRHFTDLF